MTSPVVLLPSRDPVYLHRKSVAYLNLGYQTTLLSTVQGVQVQGEPVSNGGFQLVPEQESGTMCLVMGHGNHLHKGQSWKAWNAQYFERLRLFFERDLRHRGWVKKVVILVDSDIPGLEYQCWAHELFRSIQAAEGSSEMDLPECLQVVVSSQSQRRWTRHGAPTSQKTFTVYINRTQNGPPTGIFTTEYSWPVDCMQEVETIGNAFTLDSLVLHNPVQAVAFFDSYDVFAADVISTLEMNKNIRRLEFTLDLAPSVDAILQICRALGQLHSLTIREEHPMATQSTDLLRMHYGGLPSLFSKRISLLQGLQYLEIPGFLASKGLYTVLDRMIPFPVLVVDGRPVDFHAALRPSPSGSSSSMINL